MAAYAALVSLMSVIDQIQSHPRPPISLDDKQVQSLTAHIASLQRFLENYSIHDTVEGRIADAAYEAEDVIELHLVDKIHPAPSSPAGTSSTVNFEQSLDQVLQDFETIKREVESVNVKHSTQHQVRGILTSSGSVKPHPPRQSTMVGLDKAKIDIFDKLTGGSCRHQTISIVGTGGIGKTTLARNVYLDSFVKDRFDVRAWATVSQQYISKEILIELLACQQENGSKDSMSSMSEDGLGNMLHKSLFGRRYLIVLDDIWCVEAWNDVKRYFPKDSDNESRVMITTRLSNLAYEITGTLGHVMGFLDKDTSWKLLCRTVFGEEPCPNELEEIGKEIAESCKGLPLSIVVIGGLLAKSKETREYWHWQHIALNLKPIVMSEDDERCSKVLQMSYDQLPVHLKPCFLYMGVYPEDCDIYIPKLMRLWVAEGFLKPIANKSLEQVAQEYFNELIDRNLVFASQHGYDMKKNYCKIHDLLMNLCVREAQKHRFLFVTSRLYNGNTPQNRSNQRRVVIHQGTNLEVVNAVKRSAPLVRSFTHNSDDPVDPINFKLMRVWNGNDKRGKLRFMSIPSLVNCRYIDSLRFRFLMPKLVPLFWNLQTLIDMSREPDEPLQIWKMLQLRHVKVPFLHLSDPDKTDVVLRNLENLSTVQNLKFTQGFVERIPNMKKLRLSYGDEAHDWPSHCLNNLSCFDKLESLSLDFSHATNLSPDYLSENLVFPESIRKLTLEGTGFSWEDMARKIGCLPSLEVLKLRKNAFVGPEWETGEGQFSSLRFLTVSSCDDLERWRVESSTHFPCLEQVVLEKLEKLKELPREIGDVMTLRSIELICCSDGAVISARNIIEEQVEQGNEGLRARVVLSEKNEESLAAPNFQVEMLCSFLARKIIAIFSNQNDPFFALEARTTSNRSDDFVTRTTSIYDTEGVYKHLISRCNLNLAS